MTRIPRVTQPGVQVDRGIVIWSAGSSARPVDVWFHPGLGDSHASYREAFASRLPAVARVYVFDPPGHGASPPRRGGLTIDAAARLWAGLVARHSRSRRVVLVGHSMAAMIASETARRRARAPALVVSVDGNLTGADAWLSGRAVRHAGPAGFHAELCERLRPSIRGNDVLRRYACSFDAADPKTLWTLGRSVVARADPGASFRRLLCAKVHYWDGESARPLTSRYIARHSIPARRLDGLGHWPMVKAPAQFYAVLTEDILRHALSARRPVTAPFRSRARP